LGITLTLPLETQFWDFNSTLLKGILRLLTLCVHTEPLAAKYPATQVIAELPPNCKRLSIEEPEPP
jgi:hypothetical protein